MPPPDGGPPCLPCAGHSPASCLWSSTIARAVLVGGRNLPFSILFLSYQPIFFLLLKTGVQVKREQAVVYRQGCSASTGDTCWGPLVWWPQASLGEQRGDYSSRSSALGLRQVIKLGFLLKGGKDEKLMAARKAYRLNGMKVLERCVTGSGREGREGERGELAGRNTKFTSKASANAETNYHIGKNDSFASRIANKREMWPAGASLLTRCCVGVMITVLIGLAGQGKDGQGSFHSAKCMRKMHAKKPAVR